MAMRRPRIKPVANILLNSKRKSKLTSNDVKSKIVGENVVNSVQDAENVLNSASTQESKCLDGVDSTVKVIADSSADTTANRNNLNNNAVGENVHEVENNTKCEIRTKNESDQNVSTQKVYEVIETLNDSDAFKYPPQVGFQRTISHTSNGGLDDVFYSDIEENALQMDSEKSSLPMSPSKNLARQRIRPTPHFGQRRNSFVGSSPSPHTFLNDENHTNSHMANEMAQTTQTRRERHHSASSSSNSHATASLHQHPYTPHKYLPTGITNGSSGRIRTESGCSVFSDTNSSTHKLRKIGHKHRRDFEARFHNRIPEKNAIKMCDFIYYNPPNNPMEKKTNICEKLEKPETSSIDAKPSIEKVQKDTEAVPVPQLKLNAKGELILDDSSLVIETTAEQEARKVLANSSLIYLDECTAMNGFYTRRRGTRKWSPSDTIKFYRCLQNVGTDFSLMVDLFPNRTRRDIKLKFKKEERKNGHLINKAIVHPKLFDMELLKHELNEEEKRLEKADDAKKKPKKKEKKKNSKSKAVRLLANTKGVYENETDVKPKVVSAAISNSDKSDDVVQIEKETTASRNDRIETAICEKVTVNEVNERKRKNKNTRKRKYFYKKFKRENKYLKKNADAIINLHINPDESVYQQLRRYNAKKAQKAEIIKIENKKESHQIGDLTEYQDSKQLQTEIDELLGSDGVDIQYDNTSYDTSIDEHITHEKDCIHMDIDKYEHTSFVNLDDGSLEVYSSIRDDNVFITPPKIDSTSYPSQIHAPHSVTQPPIGVIYNENNLLNSTFPEPEVNNDTSLSVIPERELSEADIQSILTELAEGSLVLVSTLDPDDPDKVLNEIYMVDKNTGDLCDEPLSIPDNIVQCILTVVS